MPNLDELLRGGAPPVIAILRGLRSHEARDIGAALVGAGIRIIEVPLNSPDPFDSIAALVEALGDQALIGGGTIVDPAMVEPLARTGAELLVSPNCNPAIIEAGLSRGMEVLPGVFTPSEAFSAVAAGAQRLKLFPASSLPQGHLKALTDVLPGAVKLWAVGGVDAGNASEWLAADAEGVAVGSCVYRPHASAADVGKRAAELVAALNSGSLPSTRVCHANLSD